MNQVADPTLSLSAPAVLGRVTVSYPRLLRILVPLDFSGKSRQALRYAVPIAHKFAARIHLVHVLPADGMDRDETLRRRMAALKRLGRMGAQYLPPLLHAESAVPVGQPAGEILALAEKNTIDLIVLTTRTGGDPAGSLAGSTAETIMRLARCPVMAVPRLES